MQYQQEKIASQFYQDLQDHFAEFNDVLQITLQGAGVHWHCWVTYQNRTCDVYFTEGIPQNNGQPLYTISFLDNNQHLAEGRINDVSLALVAISQWIEQATLLAMYANFDFVDHDKRNLEHIAAQMLHFCPALWQVTTAEVTHDDFRTWQYMIVVGDRACKLVGFGIHEPIAFDFIVDETTLFKLERPIEELAQLVKHWLIANWMPSKIEAHFPEIQIGQLAKYYERDQLIEGEFLESWDSVESYYRKPLLDQTPDKYNILDLIDQIRTKGYDIVFRASRIGFRLQLLRMRDRSYEENHPYILIDFRDGLAKVTTEIQQQTFTLITKIAYTPELEIQLEKLKQQPLITAKYIG